MKGRVAALKGFGQPFDFQEYEVPEPEPGAILLKVSMAGVCGSDLHRWRGDTASDALPPSGLVQGHEMTGTVYRLGDGVTTDALGQPLREGDRVCYNLNPSCFHCPACVRGWYNLCTNRPGYRASGVWPYFTGTFADYFYLRPNHFAYRVPDELSDDVVTPVNCAMATVLQGLMTTGVLEGESVVIQGAGCLGLTATAMTKDMGAHPVITLDRLPHRLEMAKEFGADYTINVAEYDTPQARIEQVRELTGGTGAYLVVELVGLPELLPEGVTMLRSGGTFLEIGNIVRGRTVTFDPSTILSGKRIIGSTASQPGVIPKVFDFLLKSRGRYPFEKMVSHKFKLADIDRAFQSAEWATGTTEVVRACLVP